MQKADFAPGRCGGVLNAPRVHGPDIRPVQLCGALSNMQAHEEYVAALDVSTVLIRANAHFGAFGAATASADAITRPIATGVDFGPHAYTLCSAFTPLDFTQVHMNDCFMAMRIVLHTSILFGLTTARDLPAVAPTCTKFAPNCTE